MIPEPSPVAVRALAADLRTARFTSDAVRAAWGELADDAMGRGTRVPALRALGDRRDATAVLARLLVLGVAQPVADVVGALPTLGVDGLVGLGVAEVDGEIVRPCVVIRPQAFVDESGVGEWWIASDLDELALGGPIAADHVLGVGGASSTLAGLQAPTPARRVLDLGTGCGIQALRARRFADHVVATDISESALRFTRLNALLNGVDAIETRAGSMFDPVVGEQFDRVISNPPFVITPRGADVPEYEYRDGGMRGDDLVASFVSAVGVHLRPGGVAQLLGNWEYRDGVDGLDRVREWVDGSPVPLDAWVVEREQLDPIEYASMWIRDGGTVPGSPAHDRLLEAWLDDFAERGVTSVGFGYLLLRRPVAAVSLRRFERVGQPVAEGNLGAHIAGALARHDELAGIDDGGLGRLRFVVAPDVTEARHHRPGNDAPSVIELRQGGGFARTHAVDAGLAAFVGASDGDLSADVLVDAIAQLLEVDPGALRSELWPRVRELVTDGFLTVAD